MAVTSIMNSTDVVIQISEDGGSSFDIIGRTTSASLSVSMETRDTTNKDSAGWQENLEGLKAWSLSGDGLVTYSISGDYDTPDDLFTLLSNRTKVKVQFGSMTAGEIDYTGDAYLTSYEQEAGVEENVSYSFGFTGTGVLLQAAVPS
jgi:TP901-1 family phage major tail protein